MKKDLIEALVESQSDLGGKSKERLKLDIELERNQDAGKDPVNDIIYRAGTAGDIDAAANYIDYCINQLQRASRVLNEWEFNKEYS
tara:strand:+ start:14520 stop:14777 length:258 start_codon:yes stop_codon:yes gene_type:complete